MAVVDEDPLDAVRAAVLMPQLSYRTLAGDHALPQALGGGGGIRSPGTPGGGKAMTAAAPPTYATIDNDVLRRRPGDASSLGSTVNSLNGSLTRGGGGRGGGAGSRGGFRPLSNGSGSAATTGGLDSDTSDNTSVGSGGVFLPTQAVELVVAYAGSDTGACLRAAHVNRQWRRCVLANQPLWRTACRGRVPPGWDALRSASFASSRSGGGRLLRGLPRAGGGGDAPPPSRNASTTAAAVAPTISAKDLATQRRRTTATPGPPPSTSPPSTHYTVPAAMRAPVTAAATMPLGSSSAVVVVITGYDDGCVAFHLASDPDPAAALCVLTPQQLHLPLATAVANITVVERSTTRWVAVAAGDAVGVLEVERVSAFQLDPASLKTLKLRPTLVARMVLPVDVGAPELDGSSSSEWSRPITLPGSDAVPAGVHGTDEVAQVVVHPRLPLVATRTSEGRVWLWDVKRSVAASRPSTPGLSQASSASTRSSVAGAPPSSAFASTYAPSPLASASVATTPSAASVGAWPMVDAPAAAADLLCCVDPLPEGSGSGSGGTWSMSATVEVLCQNAHHDGELLLGMDDGWVCGFAWREAASRGGTGAVETATATSTTTFSSPASRCRVRRAPTLGDRGTHRHAIVALQCDTAGGGSSSSTSVTAAGHRVVSMCRSGVLAVRRADDIAQVLATHRLNFAAPPTALAFAHGYLLAGGADGSAVVLSAAACGAGGAGEERRGVARQRGGYSGAAAAAPPPPPMRLEGHTEPVTHAALHVVPAAAWSSAPPQWRAITAGSRGKVLLWNSAHALPSPVATLADLAGPVSTLVSTASRRSGELLHACAGTAHHSTLACVSFPHASG